MLDQYFRRGKLSAELFHAAKIRIERHALGLREPVAIPERFPGNKPLTIVGNAPVAVVPAPEPAPAPVPPPAPVSPHELGLAQDQFQAELSALRTELERARRLAALYLERLTAIEWRTSAANFHSGDQLRQDDRPNDDRLKYHWRGVSKRQAALLIALTGILALTLTTNRSSTTHVPLTAPMPPAPVATAVAPPPTMPGQLRLAAGRYIVLPGQTQATIAIQRTGGTTGAVSIHYWTVDLGARAGQDYLPRGDGTVTIPDGQDHAQIKISILPTRHRRHTELFELRIGRPSAGATLGETVRTTVFLLPP